MKNSNLIFFLASSLTLASSAYAGIDDKSDLVGYCEGEEIAIMTQSSQIKTITGAYSRGFSGCFAAVKSGGSVDDEYAAKQFRLEGVKSAKECQDSKKSCAVATSDPKVLAAIKTAADMIAKQDQHDANGAKVAHKNSPAGLALSDAELELRVAITKIGSEKGLTREERAPLSSEVFAIFRATMGEDASEASVARAKAAALAELNSKVAAIEAAKKGTATSHIQKKKALH